MRFTCYVHLYLHMSMPLSVLIQKCAFDLNLILQLDQQKVEQSELGLGFDMTELAPALSNPRMTEMG